MPSYYSSENKPRISYRFEVLRHWQIFCWTCSWRWWATLLRVAFVWWKRYFFGCSPHSPLYDASIFSSRRNQMAIVVGEANVGHMTTVCTVNMTWSLRLRDGVKKDMNFAEIISNSHHFFVVRSAKCIDIGAIRAFRPYSCKKLNFKKSWLFKLFPFDKWL